MKNYCFILLFLFSIPTYSQWYSQSSVGVGESFNACAFYDTLNGWVCGANGIIVHTSDGGTSWVHQNSQTQKGFESISFYSLNSGWAVGNEGIIVHTTDGGFTWVDKSIFLTEMYLTVTAINDSSCWIAAPDIGTLFTSNHGDTWEVKPSIPNYHINRAHFFDDKKGVALAYTTNSLGSYSKILRTADGGSNWYAYYDTPGTLIGLSFVGQKFGWVVGSPGIHRLTTNGGGAWLPMHDLPNQWMDKIYFADSLHGFASTYMVANYAQNIYRTTDGGWDWIYCYTTGYDLRITGISYVNKNIGWIVGDKGTIIKTTNGGVNWFRQYSIFSQDDYLMDVCFVDKNIGWAGGSGALFYTTNGGAGWNRLNTPSYYWINSLQFINTQLGWAACDKRIIKTTDGGKTWVDQIQKLKASLSSIQFIDSLNGWTCGIIQGAMIGQAFRTTNGGVSWKLALQDSNVSFESVHFINKDSGFIVGDYGKIYKTTDGGDEWRLDSLPVHNWLKAIHFSDPMNGLIVGQNSAIFKTVDGGNSWNDYSFSESHILYSVHMIDPLNAWTAGDELILKTNDGGLTWINSTPTFGVPMLSSIMFIDTTVGWTVGPGILRYGFITDIKVETGRPDDFNLYQNYPNPFNPITRITYNIAKEGLVNIKVYDILGKEITTLVNDVLRSGSYEVLFNGSDLSSGVYFYRMIVNDKVLTRKSLLVK